MGKYALSLISLIAIASVSQSIAQSLTHCSTTVSGFSFLTSKVTQIQLYMQANDTGTNETGYRIANSSITDTSPTLFGFLDMADFLLTNTSDPNSNVVGRAQGLFGSADLNEPAYYNNFNYYFTSGDYNGSTLHIVGRDPLFADCRELSVSGGTQFFRLATGIVTFSTITLSLAPMFSTIEVNLTVIQPIIA